MFRGRGGPTDGRLPKQNAARRRPAREPVPEAASPAQDSSASSESERELEQQGSIEHVPPMEVDNKAPGPITTEDSPVESPPRPSPLQKELQHLQKRISNVQNSFGSITLYDLPTYQANVLNAVLNCVAEWRHIVGFHGDHLLADQARQGGQQIFELVQASLQTGPLSGAKPGYFKRCGRSVATAVHSYLVRIAATDTQVATLHWTDKQTSAFCTWTQQALRASESTEDDKIEPSKSVQKQQQKAMNKKQAKQQKRLAKKKQLGLV